MLNEHSTNGKRRKSGQGLLRLRKDGLYEGRTSGYPPKSFYGRTPEEVERKMRIANGDPLPEHLLDLDGDNVYFIQASTGGPIKIGLTTDVNRRLKELQMCCPIPLQIIHVIPGGDQKLEKQLHKSFSLHRLHGEWFDATGDLLKFIHDSKKVLKNGRRKSGK